MSANDKPRSKLDLSGLTQSRGLSGLAAEANKDKILLLDPSEIEAPDQVRRVFRNIEELRATIDAEGQQSPVIVGPKKANGKYELLKGGRRLKAASLEPVIKIKAIVDTTNYNEDEAVLSQLVENIQRDDLLPHEIGRAFLKSRELAKARGENRTNRAIAARVGKSETYVSLHISLAELPDELIELIETGVTRDTDILHNLRTLGEVNADVYRRVVAEARETRTLDRASVREAVKLAKAIQSGELPPDATEFSKPAAPPAQAQAQPQNAAAPRVEVPPATANTQEPPQSTEQAGAKRAAPAAQNLPHAEGGFPPSDASSASQRKESATQDDGQAHAGQSAPSTEAGAGGQQEDPVDSVERQVAKKQISILPEQLIIFVRVVFDSNAENGHLLTDRVCTDPNKVFVNIVNTEGQAVAKLVPVDSVEIISVGHRP